MWCLVPQALRTAVGEGPSTHLCSPGVGPAPASRLPGVWPQAGSSWSAKSDLQDGVPSLPPPPRGPSGAPGGLLSGSRRPPPDTTAIRQARCWPEQGGPGMLAAIPLCPRQCPVGAIPGFRARLGARVSPARTAGGGGERGPATLVVRHLQPGTQDRGGRGAGPGPQHCPHPGCRVARRPQHPSGRILGEVEVSGRPEGSRVTWLWVGRPEGQRERDRESRSRRR